MDKIKTVRPRTESGAQLQLILWTKNMSLKRGVIFYTYSGAYLKLISSDEQ